MESIVKSAFDPKTCSWNIEWPGRVARHDLVYLSPPEDPMQGMPLGNGDIGVLAWCEGSKVILVVNKCDLWDDAKTPGCRNWEPKEEDYATTLRHACRIIFDFGQPVFDLFYLSDFNGRLSLADASLRMTAAGPFGGVTFEAFVDHDTGAICCKVDSDLHEDVPIEVTMERYGSRTFSHWYSLVNRDPTIGVEGTRASVDGTSLHLEHTLTSGVFAVGCEPVAAEGLQVKARALHSHAATLTISGGARKHVELIAAVTSPIPDGAAARLDEKLSAARRAGMDALFAAHREAWKAFWLRSLMEFGDDYLDNLWHVTMYYANASQRGSYPGRFIGGLWTWNRDVQQWNYYFHWNQQETYWPLNPAGHHELMDSYLEYRFRSLPYAKKDAEELLHAEGAWVSDVCDRRGYNSVSEVGNQTPVAEIALDFWRRYRFTGNRGFLRERALPYMLEAARFFASLLKKGEDGRYHLPQGYGYEGWIWLRDAITVLGCAGALFPAVLSALEEAKVEEREATQWREIAANLAPLPVMEADSQCVEQRGGRLVFTRGMFKGEPTFSGQFLAAGFGIEAGRMLASRFPISPDKPAADSHEADGLRANSQLCPPDRPDLDNTPGIFPTTEFAPVFPSGMIGLAQAGTEVFKAACNTAKLYSPDCMGWDVVPMVLARLGLGAELVRLLKGFPGRWQCYCNGWGHYGPWHAAKSEGELRFRRHYVRDAGSETGDRFPFPSWPFRHMGLESMSVLATAMNEALLQSNEDAIRVAPATADSQHARFTLHAADGFVVSAEISDGSPQWVAVRSLRGGRCRIVNPWPKAYVCSSGSREQDDFVRRSGTTSPAKAEAGSRKDEARQSACCSDARTLEFEMQAGECCLIAPDGNLLADWVVELAVFEENRAPKLSSDRRSELGLPRMF